MSEQLPRGWAIGYLTSVAELNPPRPEVPVLDTTEVSFVPMASVEEMTGRMDTSTTRRWSDVKKGFTRFQEGDVVLAKITPSMENGKAAHAVNLTNRIGAGTTEFHVFRPHPEIEGRYVLHYLLQEAFRRRARSRMTGTAGQLRVPSAFLEEETLPIAPAAEQRRIVEAIESYLSRLDAAVASLEQAQAKLRAYRASVLKAAVEGRLVPTEAELARAEKRDYEPADVLLTGILAERRRRWEDAELAKLKSAGKTRKDDKWKAKYQEPVARDMSAFPKLPGGWCWANLDQLITEPLANGKSVPDGKGFPVLRLTCIGGGTVELSERKAGDWRGIEPAPFRVQRDDFLIVRGNGSLKLVGRGGRVVSAPDPVAYPDTLIRARIAPDALQPSLVPRWWDAPPVRRHLERRARTTAGIHKVNQSDLEETPLPLPPAAEQVRIADEIERLDSVAATTLRELEQTLNRCARLRQSILKWAFEGKLVKQDPNDEPAEKLLGRVRAERAELPPVKTSRGRRAKAAS